MGGEESESGEYLFDLQVSEGDSLVVSIHPDEDSDRHIYVGIASPDGKIMGEISRESPFFVSNEPQSGKWHFRIVSEGFGHFSISVAAFGNPPFDVPRESPIKCKACKIIAKALAAAIVAAALLPHIPVVLVDAVAKFLGILAASAAAFITSVVNDMVDIITEKLCRMIGFCP